VNEQLQLQIAIPDELVELLAQRILERLEQRQAARAAPAASPWLTFAQACIYLGLSRNALYKLTAARAIPCRKKHGGQGLRFHRDELDQWMRDQYPRLDRLG
jgi:excisionase family DNA binding protein